MKSILICAILFSQVLFAADEGIFMVVKGKVKIVNSASSADAKVGSKIYEGDTVVTETDSRAKIVMSDRNIINVSPNTRLKIEKYSSNPKDKNVRLNLIEGKVRNNVEQKYNSTSSKFEVRTATAVAGVRGTQFITSYNAGTRVTEVITLKGQVSFQSLNAQNEAPAGEPVVVGKGEKSEAKEGGAVSAPVQVPTQEIRQIDSETNVKKESPKNESAPAGGTAGTQPAGDKQGGDKKDGGDKGSDQTGKERGTLPTAGTNPLKDLNRDNNQVIDGANTRKFDKSKVRIITQPGN